MGFFTGGIHRVPGSAGYSKNDIKGAERQVLGTPEGLQQGSTECCKQVRIESRARRSRDLRLPRAAAGAARAELVASLARSLYEAGAALRRLSGIFLKMASLWCELEQRAIQLSSSNDIDKLVRTTCHEIPRDDTKRLGIWGNVLFKRKAVMYLSQWVAISSTCSSLANHMKTMRLGMHRFLAVNSEYATIAEYEDWQ
jgi:hypothetical protein